MTRNRQGIIESIISGVLWAAYSIALFEILDPYAGDIGHLNSWQGLSLLLLAAVGIAFIDACLAFIFELYFVIKSRQWDDFKGHLFSDSFIKILPAAIFSGPFALLPFSIASRYSVSVATSITAFYPTLGSIISVFVFKEKLSKKKLVGMLLASFGIVLTSGIDHLQILAVILAFIAAVGYALELVFGYRLLSENIDPTVSIALKQAAQILVYAILLLILVSINGFDALSHLYNNIGFNQGLAFTGVFKHSIWIPFFMILAAFFNATSYTFYYRGLSHAGVSTASSLNIAYGVWTIIILALPPFSIRPSFMTVLGSSLTFLGTALVIVASEGDS